MDALIMQLVDVIRREVDAFQSLLESLEHERDALVHHEVHALAEASAAQQALTAASAQLEAERVRIVKRLSAVLREDADSLTLKRLIERVGGAHSDRLREMRETLMDLQQKIQKANRHNALLIKQSMKYVDKSLQILTGNGSASGGVYVQSGRLETSPSPVRGMLNQIV